MSALALGALQRATRPGHATAVLRARCACVAWAAWARVFSLVLRAHATQPHACIALQPQTELMRVDIETCSPLSFGQTVVSHARHLLC